MSPTPSFESESKTHRWLRCGLRLFSFTALGGVLLLLTLWAAAALHFDVRVSWLRTPLAVVHTTTNMLLNPKYQFNEAQVREQHERIQRNVEVMNKLIGELSELAKPKPGDGA